MKYYFVFIATLIAFSGYAENEETCTDSSITSNGINVVEESEIADNGRDSDALREYLRNVRRRDIEQQLNANQE